jgi:regulator of sigma E protease
MVQERELTLTLAAKGEGKARTGYLGAGVAGGEWPAEMLREVRYGPVAAVAKRSPEPGR